MGTNIFIIALFLFFNSVLPCADVATDFYTFLTFFQEGHIKWAMMTLSWMFLPFFANILILIRSCIVDCQKRDCKIQLIELKMILLHFPFILPFRNLFNAFKLNSVNGPFVAKEIEDIYQ